jgi:protein-disulfide isomerase
MKRLAPLLLLACTVAIAPALVACDDNVALDGPRWNDRITVLPGERDPSLGSPDALVQVVVFNEYRCARCDEAITRLEKIASAHPGDVRLVVRWAGDPDDEESLQPALGAYAAQAQGQYWRFRERLEADQRYTAADVAATAQRAGCDAAEFEALVASDEIKRAVLDAAAEARALGIFGTPAIVVNGRVVVGNPPSSVLAAVIASERARARRVTAQYRLTSSALHASIRRQGRTSIYR